MHNKFKWWEAENFAFVQVPKAILSNPSYKELSANAALLYGILLDRMSLSSKNKEMFTDRYGDVFVYCTLKELERYGLISRLQQGKGRPARIYVHKFITDP